MLPAKIAVRCSPDAEDLAGVAANEPLAVVVDDLAFAFGLGFGRHISEEDELRAGFGWCELMEEADLVDASAVDVAVDEGRAVGHLVAP